MSVKVMSAIAVEQRWQDKHTKQCLPFLLKIARMKVGTRTTAVKRSGKFSMLRREIYLGISPFSYVRQITGYLCDCYGCAALLDRTEIRYMLVKITSGSLKENSLKDQKVPSKKSPTAKGIFFFEKTTGIHAGPKELKKIHASNVSGNVTPPSV